MMMVLGMFVFELSSAPYQSLEQSKSWRHASQTRIGIGPANQFLGPDAETITLSGTLYEELNAGEVSLLALEEMADTGEEYFLIEGTGWIYGEYVIESIKTTRSLFYKDGSARKIEFNLALKRITSDPLEKIMGMLS
ncbi:phage tail protein [Iodobacter sp. CM08]|uniref:phage tail protein n=1 Tax=Iodobacter sp. CM08 TaxID=3085902 RepID=UPI002981C056|nr:phage tail protein [Iodobacter sp. CM08]MDW5418909.1 phage tail protein [Iodobacter sp. CM08]